MAAKNCGNQVTPALFPMHTSPVVFPRVVRRLAVFTRATICVLFPLLWLSCHHSENLDLTRLKLPPGFHIPFSPAAPNARERPFSPGAMFRLPDTSEATVRLS